VLPDGLAIDDYAAVRFSGTGIAEVVASRPDRSAWRVTRGGQGVLVEALPARLLG